jgi:hypothetical protein
MKTEDKGNSLSGGGVTLVSPAGADLQSVPVQITF